MPGPLPTPKLDGALAAVRRRIRARRAAAFATLGVAAAVVLAGVAGLLAAGAPLFGLGSLSLAAPSLVVMVVLPVAAAIVAALVARPVPQAKAARELDRRLGLEDAVSSALAVSALGTATPLAERVIEDAETAAAAALPRIAGAFPVRPAAWSGRWLLRAAVAASVLWSVALLAAYLPELPTGSNAGRPGGTAAEPDDSGLALAVAPKPEDDPEDDPDQEDDPEDEAEKEPDPEPDKPEPEKPEAPREPPIKARIRTSKAEYASHERVLAVVSAVPTVELRGDTTYDLNVQLDKAECETGLALEVSPSRTDPTARAFDVGELSPPLPPLKPGDHEIKGLLVPRDGGPTIETEAVRFRIRGPQDGGGKNPNPKPQPQPQPQQPPPEQKPPPPKPPPPKPPPGKDGKGDPPEAQPPELPTALDKKVVMPLFREGEEIEKTGAILVLDPSGGASRPPRRRPLGDALPAARKRAESAVDRAQLKLEDRDLVRRYFEGLERRLR